jgi:hypothetical protein
MQKAPSPLTDKKDIQRNPDNKIDQDFPGFPHGIATEKLITPKTPAEKKAAAVNITDGEKMSKAQGETDEAASDGSGGAFEGTENMHDDE